MVARPEDPPRRKAWAAQAIREQHPKCQKLLMNPTACYGCENNPLKENPVIDREAYLMYSGLIDTISRMVDALHFGLLQADNISPLEFELMRMYDRAMQARRVF